MARIEVFSAAFSDCSLEPNWWLFALRGLLALLFGGVALCLPVAAVLALTLLFGAYLTVDGVCHLASGLSLARRGRRWGGLVLGGALGVALGLASLIVPQAVAGGVTGLLWTLVAVWAMATGVLDLATAIRLRRESRGGWLMAWSGGLAVGVGVAMAVLYWRNPLVTMRALGWLLAVKALGSGLLMLMLAFQLHKLQKRTSYAVTED